MVWICDIQNPMHARMLREKASRWAESENNNGLFDAMQSIEDCPEIFRIYKVGVAADNCLCTMGSKLKDTTVSTTVCFALSVL